MTGSAFRLTTDTRVDPMGIGSVAPEFGWRVDGPSAQVAYEIEVRTAEGSAGWRSGRIESAEPFGVRYGGAALRSRQRYHWRVRLWFADGTASGWSEPSRFETGILHPGGWRAAWISDGPSPAKPPAARRVDRRTLYFRTAVEVPARVVRARAYASALGWYRLFVNRHDITGPALVPRWTPLDEYVEYQVYDVTDRFLVGVNVIGMVVADGRYRGRNGAIDRRAIYGTRLAALVQVELELAGGTALTLCSDDSWTVGGGPIRSADPKWGERVDLRVGAEDWLAPAGAPLDPAPVTLLAPHPRRLVAEEVGPVTAVRRLPGVVSRAPSGAQVVDFGQNVSGVARVRLAGPRGRTVSLRYSEVLTPDGELDVRYLDILPRPRTWFQRDEVTLGGEPVDHIPWFTIRGFRYLAIDGLSADLRPDDVEAVVLSTDVRQTAEFASSNPSLDRLWHNCLWSLRGNFLDTPTDCPTRERSGWTGDIQVFGATAATLVDADAYLRRYLRNLATEQHEDGGVPWIVPSETSEFRKPGRRRRPGSPAAGWGDVAVLLPWTLYRYYGDVEVLRRQYPSARAWVDAGARRAATRRGVARRFGRRVGALERYVVDTGYHWGEWLRPGESVGAQILRGILTPPAVVATAYLAHSARVLARIAAVLGEAGDARAYGDLADNVRLAWRAAFVRRDGRRIGADKQDDYVRALAFDLVPDAQRPAAFERLVELIDRADGHLGTGFLSTPMLLPTLVEGGRPDLAYRILLQTTPPSWLGQVARGATTIWENWDGYDRRGRARMSHNHYAFGAVASFLHEYVAGLRPAEPGYRRIRVEPVIGGGLTCASTAVDTPYGCVRVAWYVEDGRVRLTLTVPPGVTADVHLGGAAHRDLGAGEHRLFGA